MEEEDFSKLPVDERCAHKSWKARVSGYEEAVKLFNQWDGDDANWKKVNLRQHFRLRESAIGNFVIIMKHFGFPFISITHKERRLLQSITISLIRFS